jgi:hypothetical protein
MKRLFSSFCLIICLPILFAGSPQCGDHNSKNPGYGVATACEMGSMGNVCDDVEHKPPAQPTSKSAGTGGLPSSLGSELAALGDVLLIWALRL